MKVQLDFGVAGIGMWSPALPGWEVAQKMLCVDGDTPADPAARPPALCLAAGERRRAPDTVLLAVEAAQQACAMAGCDAASLAHVFASAYGDLSINDYLCATLARTPREVSPTKFHNSVHNAPAGYWAIATGCHENSSAISAGDDTFGAGLLEAALLAHEQSRAVLLCAYDAAACGPLREVIPCRERFAVALVLTPSHAGTLAHLRLRTREVDVESGLALAPSVLQPCDGDNPAARSLPLLAALARRQSCMLGIAAAPAVTLELEIEF